MRTRKPRATVLAILLMVPLAGCGVEVGAPGTPTDAAASREQAPTPVVREDPPAAATPDSRLPPMMPGRIHAPTVGKVACPSLDFDAFIRAFFNSGDLQVRFTAKPYELKGPYYEQYNTEPGDPANPQWAIVEVDSPLHGLYRYDSYVQDYILDSSRLRPGQLWTGLDEYGKHIQNPVAELSVRKVSDAEYTIDTPGRTTTFSRRADCWYLTRDWTLDPAEGCKWPDECRALREYKAPYYEDE